MLFALRNNFLIFLLLLAFLLLSTPSFAEDFGPQYACWEKTKSTLIECRKESSINSMQQKNNKRIAAKSNRFITFGTGGWLRAYPPSKTALTYCKVGLENFLCLPSEKERFEKQLTELSREVKARPHLR